MTASKYDLQFIHQSKPYRLILYDADIFKEEHSITKVNINGRNYAIANESLVPETIIGIFDSLSILSSDDELLNKLDKSPNVEGLSITKKVFNLASEALLSTQNLESSSAIKLKNDAFSALKLCDPVNETAIKKIIDESKCSVPILFDIADRLENVELAQKIRHLARPFNLKSTIQNINKQLSGNHFDKSKGEKYAKFIESRFAANAYDRIHNNEELANILTADLREVSNDNHFEVEVKRPTSKISQTEKDQEEIERLNAGNFGFGLVKEFKEIATCLLEIHKMENPKISLQGKELTKQKAIEIIKQIKNMEPQAVIFDLRKNSGGSPYMSELFCNYFEPGETEQQLCRFEYSSPIQQEEKIFFPTEPCKIASYDSLPKEERVLKPTLYILTSHETMSAAEDFVCHFKERNKDNNRVIVIGERTCGAAHLAKLFDAGEFNVAIPIGGAVVPYEGYNRNWEVAGIMPHIEVAQEEALDKALNIIRSRYG